MLQGILSLVIFGVVFNIISSTDSGRVILYIFAAAGALGILVSLENSGKSVVGFVVSLTVASIVGFLVYSQLNSNYSCDGYYYAKKDTYGGARQSGIDISADKYDNICQYAGFQSACSAYNDCLREPASHRPMVIFLNIILILSSALTFKLIPYNLASNSSGKSNKSNAREVKFYDELSKASPTTPIVLNLDDKEIIRNEDDLTKFKSDIDIVPYNLDLLIEQKSEFSKTYFLKRSFAKDFQENKLRYWILKSINEDLSAINKGFNAYCNLIIDRTCNGGQSFEFNLNLAYACSHGWYKHGKNIFVPPHFYTKIENDEEITKFLIDKDQAMMLLPITFDFLVTQFSGKKRIKSNVRYFEETWRRIIVGFYDNSNGVFASEIFNNEFKIFPPDQISLMSNECRRMLIEKFNRDVSVLDHWLQKIVLAGQTSNEISS